MFFVPLHWNFKAEGTKCNSWKLVAPRPILFVCVYLLSVHILRLLANAQRGGAAHVSLYWCYGTGWVWTLTGAARGPCKEKFRKWYHMQKQPLGVKHNWAGSVSLSWIWLLDLLSVRVRPIFLGGLESLCKCAQFLIATLHNSAKSLGMLLYLGAARCCKQKLNQHLSEKPKQDRWFMLRLKCGCFQHSFLKWTGNRKNREDDCFCMAVAKQIKTSTNFPFCPSSPYPAFFWGTELLMHETCLIFMLPGIFIFVTCEKQAVTA